MDERNGSNEREHNPTASAYGAATAVPTGPPAKPEGRVAEAKPSRGRESTPASPGSREGDRVPLL